MNNLKVIFDYDNNPTNPRDWAAFTNMVCFHKRYCLGDKHNINPNNYTGWDSLKINLVKYYSSIHTILPLFLLDHSGLQISTKPFGDVWDSGQIGFIFITKETVKENNFSKKDINTILHNHVNIYNNYLTGKIYQFKIVDECHNILFSAGDYHDYEECQNEGKEMLENFLD